MSAKQRRLSAFQRNGFDRSGRHEDWDRVTDWLRYDAVTGEVLESGVMPVAGVRHLKETKSWAYLPQSAKIGTHYIDLSGSMPRRRTRSACPAQVSGHVLFGQPASARVTVVDPIGDVAVIDHGGVAVEFEFSLPGTYVIRVESVPHTDGVYRVEVAP